MSPMGTCSVSRPGQAVWLPAQGGWLRGTKEKLMLVEDLGVAAHQAGGHGAHLTPPPGARQAGGRQ